MADLRNGLLIHLTFDEAEGLKVKDRSPHGNNGVMTDVAWVGNLPYFDGGAVNDAIDVSNSNSLNSPVIGTVSIWYKGDRAQANFSALIAKANGGAAANISWLIYVTTTAIHFDLSDGSVDQDVTFYTTDWTTDLSWHHLVMIWTGSLLIGYLDGKLISSVAQTRLPQLSTSGIRIGYYATQRFKGYLKNIKVYNRILSTEEVRALYLETR
jgi:hypothetical protein